MAEPIYTVASHGNDGTIVMTSSIGVAPDRDSPGVRGGTTRTGRAPEARQLVRPPRWKLAALTWFGVFPVVTAMLTLGGPWLELS
jgi:hypothetical protein